MAIPKQRKPRQKQRPKLKPDKVFCMYCGTEIAWKDFDEPCINCGAIEVRVTWSEHKRSDVRRVEPVANQQVEKL